MNLTTTIITKNDIARMVSHVGADSLIIEFISALKRAFLEFDDRTTEVRKRDGFAYYEPTPGVLEWMPVMEAGVSAVAKLVGYNPANPATYGLPTIISTISLYDVRTGHLIALSDATFLTALRTGAASAIASSILARPGSEIVGLVGCGAQAVTQLHALSQVFEVKRVLIHDIDLKASQSFIRRAGFLGLDIRIAPLPVLQRESDIICTATSVSTTDGPVIEDSDLKTWLHVNAIGSDLPGKSELPLSLLKRSLVCPDFLVQALVEGECQRLSPDEIGPSLVDLVKNESDYEPYRHKETVFDSTGFAVEDKVGIEVLLNFANELGLGTICEVESVAWDPLDPYSFAQEPVLTPAENPSPFERGGSRLQE